MRRGSVRVICRVRPCCAEEWQSSCDGMLRSVQIGEGPVLNVMDQQGEPIRDFAMDGAFGEDAKTADIFASLRCLMHRAAYGGSAAVLAYGPSGGGKTHTMYGNVHDLGLVPRAAAELLGCSCGKPISVSMLELHNNTLTDLLAPRGAGVPHTLEVRGGSRGTMATIEGAREITGTSVAKLLAAVHAGLARRQVAATRVNSTSSRSHVLVTFGIGTGRLMFVDLAGIERVKRSGAEGSVLREAQNINQALQSLGDVVDALRRGAPHIPFRNTQLARLVSGALGGGAETAVVVCVSPNMTHAMRQLMPCVLRSVSGAFQQLLAQHRRPRKALAQVQMHGGSRRHQF